MISATIHSSGPSFVRDGFTVNGPSGLGYGTGAGGTVTQTPDKFATVTMNRPSVRIQTSASAIGPGVEAYFTVSNNLVMQSDTVTVNIVGGAGSPINYQVRHLLSNTGSFVVGLKNISAGTLAEAILIQCNLHKGATA